ncbi:LysR family transcriptional regulator [Magnetospira sp. QH-2]|uniref:LysR family transcriptional regulator n=1 Tax=Magnetospira sp. (strain QH-2) TaxID=1288970 RepID=UPI0003E8194B|nr:LysR family transcriptional regulator [Magnetospira sp. QH-2]CCQ72085.1 transcriptional activator [Magnetospira sp. QH-2]
MNLAQLRYVTAVDACGSFSEAAKRCCVTQPTLSNGIAQLEEELGGKLFRRTTRSVTITRFGSFILPLAQAVLDAKDELQKSAQAYFQPDSRILRIGLSPLIDNGLFSGALQALKQRGLWSETFLKQCFIDDLGERLTHDTLDLALQPRQSRSRYEQSHPLYDEPLFYIPPQTDVGSPGANGVEVAALAEQPIILTNGCGLSDVIGDLFARESVPLTPYAGQALTYGVVAEWADLGIAGGILPRSKLPESSVACPIVTKDGTPAHVHFEAAWTPGGPNQAVIEESVHVMARTLSALSAGCP